MKITSLELFLRFQKRSRAVGWSLSELCRRAGVSRATLALWRLGGTNPTIGTIEKLESVLVRMEKAVASIDLEDAMGGVGSEGKIGEGQRTKSGRRASRGLATSGS